MNLEAIDQMVRRFTDVQLIFVKSGGNNLSATFSPELVDATIFVIDVAEGNKIPRKGGTGITRSDLLVINKTDLAPYVVADLAVMERNSRKMRGRRPFMFTNIRGGEGVADVVAWARRTTRISVSHASCLYYAPLPVISYANSHFESTLDVELADGTSRFVLASVVGAGRVAHGECFAYTRFAELVRVRRAGKLIYHDNTLFRPADTDMAGYGMYEGHTRSGTLAIFGAGLDDERLNEALAIMDETEGTEGGATRAASGDVVVRLLGSSGEGVLCVLSRILEGSKHPALGGQA